MDEPQPKRKTPSDQLRQVSVQEYIAAHSRPGNGPKGFFHSNLFAALLVWILSQAVIIGGAVMSFWIRTALLMEWKGSVDATLKRMDEQGTVRGKSDEAEEQRDISRLETRVDKLEDVTKHVEVIESEHRRLTQDVEEIRRNPKK